MVTKQVTQGCNYVEDWGIQAEQSLPLTHAHTHSYTHTCTHTYTCTHTHTHMQHLKCVISHFSTQACPKEQWTEVQKEGQSNEWNSIIAA